MTEPLFEFTLARSAEDGLLAAKTIFLPPTAPKQYDLIMRWRFRPLALPFNAMVDALRWLMDRPTMMLLRGQAVEPLLADGWTAMQLRRWKSQPVTLISACRRHLVLDLDDVPVPEPFGAAERVADAGLYVRETLLPPEFRDVRMIACATSSTGLKGPGIARLRLFVLLDRPYEDAVLKRWARGARAATNLPLDDSIFQAGQPIYTARPIFEGKVDPVPIAGRVTVLDGTRDFVSLDVARFEAAARQADMQQTSVRHPGTRSSSAQQGAVKARAAIGTRDEDWIDVLQCNVGVDGHFYEPLIYGLGHAASSNADDEAVAAVVQDLLRERADPQRQAQYNRTWIVKTLRRFRHANAERADRLATYRQRLFSGVSGAAEPKE